MSLLAGLPPPLLQIIYKHLTQMIKINALQSLSDYKSIIWSMTPNASSAFQNTYVCNNFSNGVLLATTTIFNVSFIFTILAKNN